MTMRGTRTKTTMPTCLWECS